MKMEKKHLFDVSHIVIANDLSFIMHVLYILHSEMFTFDCW